MMIGKIEYKLLVISNVNKIAVMTAPVVLLNIPHIPTIVNMIGLMPIVGNKEFNVNPKIVPSVAPRNKEGENTPPDEPEPKERQVANNLQRNMSNNIHGFIMFKFKQS